MKEKELEAMKKIQAKEVLSDRNPNIAALIEKKERLKNEKVRAFMILASNGMIGRLMR